MRNLGDVLREQEIARSVVKELTNQRQQGKPFNITQAAENVAEHGGYGLEGGTIRNIYYKWIQHPKGKPEKFWVQINSARMN